MTTYNVNQSLQITPGIVDATHKVADRFDVYAFAGTDAPTLRASVPGGPEGVVIPVPLSSFNPPLVDGEETIIVHAVSTTDGETLSAPFPFILVEPLYPPREPVLAIS
jgi:hypothetical protein